MMIDEPIYLVHVLYAACEPWLACSEPWLACSKPWLK